MQKCTICKEEKDLSCFYKDRSKKNGVGNRCIACERSREYSDLKNNRKKERYHTDPESNRKIRMWSKEGKIRNFEAHLWRVARYRAKKRGWAFNIEATDLVIPEFCPLLGIKLVRGKGRIDSSPTIDRKIPELGYVKGNVAIISWKANRMKYNAGREDILNFAKNLVDYIS